MISKPGRFFANRAYANEYRRFAKNPNPAKKGRICPQMGLCNGLNLIGYAYEPINATKSESVNSL